MLYSSFIANHHGSMVSFVENFCRFEGKGAQQHQHMTIFLKEDLICQNLFFELSNFYHMLKHVHRSKHKKLCPIKDTLYFFEKYS